MLPHMPTGCHRLCSEELHLDRKGPLRHGSYGTAEALLALERACLRRF